MDRDSVRAAAVLHGGSGLPDVFGDVVPFHGAQLALPVVASDGVQVRVQACQTYKTQLLDAPTHRTVMDDV